LALLTRCAPQLMGGFEPVRRARQSHRLRHHCSIRSTAARPQDCTSAEFGRGNLIPHPARRLVSVRRPHLAPWPTPGDVRRASPARHLSSLPSNKFSQFGWILSASPLLEIWWLAPRPASKRVKAWLPGRLAKFCPVTSPRPGSRRRRLSAFVHGFQTPIHRTKRWAMHGFSSQADWSSVALN